MRPSSGTHSPVGRQEHKAAITTQQELAPTLYRKKKGRNGRGWDGGGKREGSDHVFQIAFSLKNQNTVKEYISLFKVNNFFSHFEEFIGK